jgi:hypothetical protein
LIPANLPTKVHRLILELWRGRLRVGEKLALVVTRRIFHKVAAAFEQGGMGSASLALVRRFVWAAELLVGIIISIWWRRRARRTFQIVSACY